MIDAKNLGKVDGFDISVEVWPEYDFGIDDFDPENYNDRQRTAYQRGEWSFVKLVVVARLRGFKLGAASLCGIEYGWLPDYNDSTTCKFLDPLEYMADDWQDLIDEAIENARQDLIDKAIENITEMQRRHDEGISVIENRRQFARLYVQVQQELFGEA